jgi:hypothetical protein
MKRKSSSTKIFIQLFIFFTIAIILKIVSLNSSFVEKHYSTFSYKYFSIFLRAVTAWIPFSLGDILYAAAFVYVFIFSIRCFKNIVQKKCSKQKFFFGTLKIIRICLLGYIIFKLVWGLNYDRLGIAYQLQIEPKEFTTNQLKALTGDLVKSVNAARNASGMYTFQYEQDNTIFYQAANAYRNIEQHHSFLAYHQPCIKPSLFNWVDNLIGVTGYYNPLTGETQINTSIPRFLLPYFITHEIAHQIGYAKEDEANFVAYLVSKGADDNAFRYSAYFNLFNYANRQLFARDSIAALINYKALDSLVKNDEVTYQNFLGNNTTTTDHYITAIYSKYLKANNQPKGINTYDEVIALLISYQKRYGEL